MPKQCNQSHPKASDPNYVCNPETGRWVKVDGPKAKQLGLARPASSAAKKPVVKKSSPKAAAKKPVVKKSSPKAAVKQKTCPPDKILNPASGRCVLRTSAIGKKLLAGKKLSPRPVSAANPKAVSAAKAKPKVVKPGALPEIYKKNDKIKNKKFPQIRALHEDVMKQHGLDFYKDLPIGSGTYAFIYDLGNNRILRLETSSGAPNPVKMALRVDQYMIKHPRPDLFPTTYSSKIHFVEGNVFRSGWTLASVMDKVDIDDWANWNKYFSSPEELIQVIKTQTKNYLDYGLIHLDPSSNNIVLTKKGEILFLDNSDGCLHKQLKRCPFGSPGTPGYKAPGWIDLGDASGTGHRKGDDRKLYEAMLLKEFNLTLKDLVVDQKNDMTNALAKNFIHGMGATAYFAITGLRPFPVIDFTKVQSTLRSMLHPDYKQRTL